MGDAEGLGFNKKLSLHAAVLAGGLELLGWCSSLRGDVCLEENTLKAASLI